VWLVDDYGHHPTEVAAVLASARSVAEGEVWIAFQPHTAHRTWALFDDFAGCFDAADHALVLPIYQPSGRDVDAPNVTSAELAAAIARRGHPDARYVESFDEATEAVAAGARPGDLVLTMGAGDVTRLSEELRKALGDRT
jgi:UDP-N-acetylmuramate--alanine ligase